ncbi:MAG: UDP-2-acetamido-3-amino-2,3-dideoxy-glucuronate N-acetyltransferase [Arenicella sp.]|jgi:UDP-2-acetamido-3-amino-2,3-dideoxy-glucuronate N-acetyltransferase
MPLMSSELKKFFVHESSYVDDGCEIGDNTSIWHFCHIISGTKIGERCNIGQNVVIGGNVIVGNGCKIQNNVSIYEGVELEDDVFCGPSMVFTNVFTPRSHVSRKNEYLPTLVRQGATIGANATIVCGNEIGAFAFIGAGSVVTKPVQSQALMVGNPAMQIGWMCKCGERLPTSNHCARCDAKYEIDVASQAIKEV